MIKIRKRGAKAPCGGCWRQAGLALPRGAILISNDVLSAMLRLQRLRLSESRDRCGVVAVVRDITEEMLQQETIEYLSYHDQLTGLHNRHYFEQQLVKLDSGVICPFRF